MNDQDAENYSYISNDLDSLFDINNILNKLETERDNKISDCIPPEAQTQIDNIGEEYEALMTEAQIAAQRLRDLIKQDVLEHGETVKGEFLMAIWNKGRESWDTKALKGYAAAHPDVLQLKKTGDPSVTIRIIK